MRARRTDLCAQITHMAQRRSSSLALFTFKGIRVQVHWSFPLLIVYVVFSSLSAGMDRMHALQMVIYVLTLFCCVVLHEFGHALTALRYGIRTRHITLFPIGGVASLERMPEKPVQELLVAIAGPAVNLVIALVVGTALLLGRAFMPVDLVEGSIGAIALLNFLVASNIGLLLFNLIPAFPMDGGRVLRALLALRMDRVKATRIASMLGRVIAFGFILYAIYARQPMLGLIGLFVIMGAAAELRQVQVQAAISGARVRDVMRTRFWSMAHDRTVQEAADELLAGGDHVLFVTREGAFDRLITREELIAAVQQEQQQQPLERIPGVVPSAIPPDTNVKEAYLTMLGSPLTLLPVVENGLLVGVLEADNLDEFVQLHTKGPGPNRST